MMGSFRFDEGRSLEAILRRNRDGGARGLTRYQLLGRPRGTTRPALRPVRGEHRCKGSEGRG